VSSVCSFFSYYIKLACLLEVDIMNPWNFRLLKTRNFCPLLKEVFWVSRTGIAYSLSMLISLITHSHLHLNTTLMERQAGEAWESSNIAMFLVPSSIIFPLFMFKSAATRWNVVSCCVFRAMPWRQWRSTVFLTAVLFLGLICDQISNVYLITAAENSNGKNHLTET